MGKIIIYTDGSSRGNPGPGGYGAIIIDKAQGAGHKAQIIEIGGREEKTTNNRMEMKAAIEALKNIPKDSEVELHTDSEYLLKGITEWVFMWQKNNWRTKDKRRVLNQDLWTLLVEEAEKRSVDWRKIEGHSGHKLNDRCDKIATGFADEREVKLYRGPKEKYFFK